MQRHGTTVKVFLQHGNEGRYFLSHGTKVMRQVDTSFISDLLEYGVVGETVFKDWTEDPHSLSPGYTFAEKVVFEKDGHYFNFKTGWAVTKS